MEPDPQASTPSARTKLGLALSGGGFRASLFHLGVLRRLAELDLLRRVEVLSTVSGGSIIGALYMLVLKRELEAGDGTLDRDGYVAVVAEVEELLRRGIRKNLRTRLVMNPFGVLRVLLTSHSLGRRMARLYERHVYARVVDQIAPRSWIRRALRPGKLLLSGLRIHPGGDPMDQGIEAYNRQAVDRGRPVATRLVVNATSLNSGARFWFSSAEVGDWYLGHVRRDEIPELRTWKAWLEAPADELDAALAAADGPAARRAIALARWWRDGREDPAPAGWEPLFAIDGFPGALPETDAGLLRRAKVPAWYLSEGSHRDPPVLGRLAPQDHWAVFLDALRRIDGDLGAALDDRAHADPDVAGLILDFVLKLYYVRSADGLSGKVHRFWETTSVGDAVGASANFPPVFPPFQLLGLYDDLHVSRLGLTDGGVFDNMGLTALIDDGCTQIIASDTSGLFRDRERVSTGRLRMMTRIGAVLQKVVASNQREALRERRRVSRHLEPRAAGDPETERFLVTRELTDLAYFHIDSPVVAPADGAERQPALADYPAPPKAYDADRRRALAGLRTDLDAFGDLEIAALVNHGYCTADRYVRRYFTPRGDPDSLWNVHWDRPPSLPIDIAADARKVDRALRAGGSRFLRALQVRAPLSWLVTLAVTAAIIAGTWELELSVRGLLRLAADGAAAGIQGAAPWIGADWTGRALALGPLLLAAVVLLVALPRLVRKTAGDAWKETRAARKVARRLATLGKWGRSAAGNVLWLLGAAPVVLALGASALGAASHFLFTKPYLWATKDDPAGGEG